MTDQQTEVLKGLLQVYTVSQLTTLLKQSQRMATEGYGTLAIIFHQHHPHRLEVSTTFSLTLKQQTTASE